MQNILALQAMELDSSSDSYQEDILWSTLSVACCIYTYSGTRVTTIIT